MMQQRSRLLTTIGAIAVLVLGLGMSGCSSDGNGSGSKTFNGKIPNPTHVVVDAKLGGQELSVSGDLDSSASKPKANISMEMQGLTMKWIMVDGKLYNQEPGSTEWTDLGEFTPKPAIGSDVDQKSLFNTLLYLISGGSADDAGSVDWIVKNSDMKNVGTETIDGVECAHWTGSDTDQGKAEIWVDPDGLDAKFILSGVDSGSTANGTWTYTNRGKDFTVEAPSTK